MPSDSRELTSEQRARARREAAAAVRDLPATPKG